VLSVTIRKLMVSQHTPHTARVQEMYALYQDGATLNKVGERYGVTRERVRQLFNKAGLATRSRREASERNRTPGPPVVEMYALHEQGATLKEVGKQFGLSGSHVGYLFKKADLQRQPRRGRPVQEMHTLYKQGTTLKEVGEQFGLSASQVSRLFKKAGLQRRAPGARVGETNG
jgi:DNA-directed RNA polymerase sigma subunit (sigma70/sigma32)